MSYLTFTMSDLKYNHRVGIEILNFLPIRVVAGYAFIRTKYKVFHRMIISIINF